MSVHFVAVLVDVEAMGDFYGFAFVCRVLVEFGGAAVQAADTRV